MRNGVVNMKQVERIDLRDFRHTRGEREIVRGIVEERIRRDLDFVEVDVGLRLAQAETAANRL